MKIPIMMMFDYVLIMKDGSRLPNCSTDANDGGATLIRHWNLRFGAFKPCIDAEFQGVHIVNLIIGHPKRKRSE